MMRPRHSPALFDHGTVGLRIVAAMSDDCMKPVRAVKKSDPIPIRGRVGPTIKIKLDDAELSESYTCVISRIGGGAAKKRVYLNSDTDHAVDVSGAGCKFEMNSGVFSDSPQVQEGFLSCCYLCRKKLNGLDIFMYRGEAFCSAECRCHQIMIDENREKNYTSRTGKSRESPISYLASLPFDAGVAAA